MEVVYELMRELPEPCNTVYRWSFPKDEDGEEIDASEYDGEVPFISSWYGVEATIIKCEVVE